MEIGKFAASLRERTMENLLGLIESKAKCIEGYTSRLQRACGISEAVRLIEKTSLHARKLQELKKELEHRVKMMEGEIDVLKEVNTALWNRCLGIPPTDRDLCNNVVVRTVEDVLRNQGDGTAQDDPRREYGGIDDFPGHFIG